LLPINLYQIIEKKKKTKKKKKKVPFKLSPITWPQNHLLLTSKSILTQYVDCGVLGHALKKEKAKTLTPGGQIFSYFLCVSPGKISGISSHLQSNESITNKPTTTTMAAKSQQFSWSRVLLHYKALKRPTKHPLHYSRKISTFPQFPTSQTPNFSFLTKSHYSTASNRVIQELLADVERERQREREQKKRTGLDTKDIDAEDEEDYMGVAPLIEKLEKEKQKLKETGDLHQYEERTDSDSDDDDERFSREAMEKRRDEFERKFKRHEELLKNFTEAGMKCGLVCLDGLSFGY